MFLLRMKFSTTAECLAFDNNCCKCEDKESILDAKQIDCIQETSLLNLLASRNKTQFCFYFFKRFQSIFQIHCCGQVTMLSEKMFMSLSQYTVVIFRFVRYIKYSKEDI